MGRSHADESVKAYTVAKLKQISDCSQLNQELTAHCDSVYQISQLAMANDLAHFHTVRELRRAPHTLTSWRQV